MISLGKYVVIQIKSFTHSNQNTFQWSTIVYNNKMIQTKFHKYILEKKSSRVSGDTLVTGVTTTNCDVSNTSFINDILPLLSVYLPVIQRSTWIIAKDGIIGHENISSWSRRRQRTFNWQYVHCFIYRWILDRILGQKNRNIMW